MVDALHGAGLEVMLDVVFNHTAEGNHLGPTLCFRGLDNPAYYRLVAGDPAPLRRHHRLRQLPQRRRPDRPAADHGLAALLADRDARRRLPLRPGPHPGPPGRRLRPGLRLLRLVSQDPVVSQAKLIAEPWDVGQADSYDIGRFPPLWREWNGKYRDTMRDFWRSHDGLIGEFADRFTGSADLFARPGRRPTASVNLITVHDGFTLADLVSYDSKHNEANGEDNRDGTDDNRSWNCGVEGPTTDPDILACGPGSGGPC